MSAVSDKYEEDVAKAIDLNENVSAERPKVSVKFADIKIHEYKGRKIPASAPVWVEVKMNHTDNLGNTRVAWDGKKWTASMKPGKREPIKEFAIEYLSKSPEIKRFLKDIEKFSGIKNPKLPTTLGGLKEPGAVPLDVMRKYFQTKPNQYILNIQNVDLGKLVTDHYIFGKEEPAYYLQAADDFYMIGNKNPLRLPASIPRLRGRGDFKMRIGLRTQYYEIQPEIKITKMEYSSFSVKPGTQKKNPFA